MEAGATAKDRLRFVLQHDRINLPPERMEQMKRDILSVIVKYVVVDKDRVEIALQQRDRNHSKLVAEIPFVKQAVPPSPEDDPVPGEENGDAAVAELDETRSDEEEDTEEISQTSDVDDAAGDIDDDDDNDDDK